MSRTRRRDRNWTRRDDRRGPGSPCRRNMRAARCIRAMRGCRPATRDTDVSSEDRATTPWRVWACDAARPARGGSGRTPTPWIAPSPSRRAPDEAHAAPGGGDRQAHRPDWADRVGRAPLHRPVADRERLGRLWSRAPCDAQRVKAKADAAMAERMAKEGTVRVMCGTDRPRPCATSCLRTRESLISRTVAHRRAPSVHPGLRMVFKRSRTRLPSAPLFFLPS